jgi:hypothetical protein
VVYGDTIVNFCVRYLIQPGLQERKKTPTNFEDKINKKIQSNRKQQKKFSRKLVLKKFHQQVRML